MQKNEFGAGVNTIKNNNKFWVCKETIEGQHFITGDIRKLAARTNAQNCLSLCFREVR